ncbi:MAG: glycoside hydrolase family 73 protein [Streptococcaceae bacterium]|jgi:flagellum-specific peptidoglycan hydrolase FlgJ|nr:glycoside hydrolase family 73 protein [Streptococcaceae bacterium]
MIVSRRKRKELRKLRERRRRAVKFKNGGKKVSVILTLTSMLSTVSILTNVKADDLSELSVSRGATGGDCTVDLIEELAKFAVPIARDSGLYPSVMLAQALLESRYGNGLSQLASPPYHNLFGIKGSFNGQSVNFPTQEWAGDHYIPVGADFRAYPDYAESVQDYADLLAGLGEWNGRDYYAGARRENALTFREAAEFLQGRYATSPIYASSLIRLIEQYELDRFDFGEYEAIVYVHRLFNPNNDLHHYTTDENEVEHLKNQGWVYEGKAFRCLREGKGMPMYRLYNRRTGHHHFTINSYERDRMVADGWEDEGIAWYVEEVGNGEPVFRGFNPGNQEHFLTRNKTELEKAVTSGWEDEGVSCWTR